MFETAADTNRTLPWREDDGYDLFKQWSNRQLNDRNKQMLNTFFKDHAHRLLSKAGYSLYQLQSRPWISSEVMRKD